ncbi:MAG: VIT and VWA domain-containing protein [Candidatus Cloacimonetes bacterium]|nr:VIT and VWA domain-containing protein [Candidatus Cloacimonadota bacterium]MCF7813351.1 VIT and VWA domain-containing protein [Candidatus Cloacimonadota bacterium]MCF7867840.1 VIT and VWA domain-containing protein [Candidatus Cloacimonadota bacterium]MCF7883274.1 VIT and VWA domain-containing protein [Candidatus Cloacimonadota bacterium]
MKKTFFLIAAIFLANLMFADGMIVIPPPPNNPHLFSDPFPLEVKYHHVNVEIDEQTAITHIDQVFINPTSQRLEGFYIFPIPTGAVLNDFTMYINGKETPAELLDAEKAREIYEDIVRQMRDPALLEYSKRNIFKVRIFPIEPHSEKRVTMSYSQILQKDNDTFEYIYPLNTEKFSAKPLEEVSVVVNLQSQTELKNIYCPTHEVEILRKGKSLAVVSYEEMHSKPDTDFKLYFDTNTTKLGMSLLSYKEKGEDGYFFLNVSPSLQINENEINQKDITFVLDVSGSMAGKKLKQAKRALNYCIENLNEDDRFDIIRFSTEAYALFEGLESVSNETRDEAFEFVNKLHSIGGTNIEEALNLALKSENKPDRPHFVIFITDGKPTIGERDEDKLVQKIVDTNKQNTRIFTFGIGDEINTHLLDKITEVTRCTRSYISPSEDIELKIASFYDKVQSPVLTDIKLTCNNPINVYQEYPQPIPDLFKGTNLTILGRYSGNGETEVVLKGMLKGKEKKFSFPVSFTKKSEKHDFIPPLWASRRIGHLLDLIRLHGESDELIDEVTQLARKHGIVTPYTSFLILEDEEIRTASNEIQPDFQTLGGGNSYAPELKMRSQSEFGDMDMKTSGRSVEVSKEFYGLTNAMNMQQTQQGKKRLDFQTKEGNTTNLTQQVKNIQGRAIYQSGKFWVDSYLQDQKPENTKQIKFASDEYFELMTKKPEAAQFLALGQNVRFLLDGIYYEVIE